MLLFFFVLEKVTAVSIGELHAHLQLKQFVDFSHDPLLEQKGILDLD